MNGIEKSKGDIISDIVLIDGYAKLIRYSKIRERINTKLEEQACEGVYVQVEIDNCDRLTLVFYVDKVSIDEDLIIRENLDRDDSEFTAQAKKTKFAENINNRLYKANLIQTKKMKQTKKGVTPSVTKEKCNSCAQDVVKIINLCRGDNFAILKKLGFDVSEACYKLTNGVVDSVIVEDGMFTFINNNGIRMSFNSVGHSEEEIITVITNYINLMMELIKEIKPLCEGINVTETCNEVSVEDKIEEPIKSSAERGGQLTTEKAEYNKLIAEAINSLDLKSGIGKRSFSQQLRGIILHCANNAGLTKEAGTSIQALVQEMTPVNAEQIRTVYELYDQKIPSWFTEISSHGTIKKRAKV